MDNIKEIVEGDINGIAQETIDENTYYNITMADGGITNAQMASAIAHPELFNVGDVYQCIDSGTYTEKHFYKFTGSAWVDTTPSGDLFYCTYGTTTYTEITSALSNGKLPVCIYNDRVYSLASSTSSVYRFSSAQSDYVRYVTINDSNVWATSAYNFELASNKVTSISNASTDTQYPSAKCVYDYLLTKQSSAQTGSSAPTTATVGEVGQLYITSVGDIYMCTVASTTYTWVQIATKSYVDSAISTSITTALNTPV